MKITSQISIPEKEIELHAVRSTGPGGQNVNKLNSAVHLRFNIPASTLPDRVKQRLLSMKDSRITKNGTVVIKARRFRTQEKNREDALARLADLIRQGMARKPPPRKLTRPTTAARKKRIKDKIKRSKIKQLRRKITDLNL